jgi:hypothetical protein
MKGKIVKTIVPVFAGIIVSLLLLVLVNFLIQPNFSIDFSREGDRFFFVYLLPFASLCAIVIQYFIALPVWNSFHQHKRVWGLTLVPFTTLAILFGGVLFGLVFWERDYGITEFFAVTASGIIAFGVYWTINILILSRFR